MVSSARRHPPASVTRAQTAVPTPSEVASQKASTALSEFEFTLTVLMFGFQRWVENCMDSSGVRGLAAIDILTLHAVNRRARRRRIAEICMVMNIHDAHLVSYSLKKLLAAELVTVEASGRERFYETTQAGDDVCRGYLRLREATLSSNALKIMPSEFELDQGMTLLGQMIAMYDHASRIAISERPSTRPPLLHTKR